EYFLPVADDDANQDQERQPSDANRDRHKQQVAGNDTSYQQPDCNEHDRKDNAEPDHARTPTPFERLGPAWAELRLPAVRLTGVCREVAAIVPHRVRHPWE